MLSPVYSSFHYALFLHISVQDRPRIPPSYCASKQIINAAIIFRAVLLKIVCHTNLRFKAHILPYIVRIIRTYTTQQPKTPSPIPYQTYLISNVHLATYPCLLPSRFPLTRQPARAAPQAPHSHVCAPQRPTPPPPRVLLISPHLHAARCRMQRELRLRSQTSPWSGEACTRVMQSVFKFPPPRYLRVCDGKGGGGGGWIHSATDGPTRGEVLFRWDIAKISYIMSKTSITLQLPFLSPTITNSQQACMHRSRSSPPTYLTPTS
jgi:hypothetical protein